MWRVAERVDDASESLLTEALANLHARAAFFDPSRPVWIARAPGRLDVMGGIADYSGSLALEYPISEATCVFAQPCDARSSADGFDDRRLTIESLTAGEAGLPSTRTVSMSLAELTPVTGPLTYAHARARLMADPREAWASYVAGALVVLQRERGKLLARGAKLLIHSDLPTGIGLSSSAALEVAALETLAALTHTALSERELAMLAQRVENFVVGAPCGVMDQLTVASGRRGCLVEILCQPAEVRRHVPVPLELELWGLDSGIRHAVSGAGYVDVRTAAFMGYRILAEAAGLVATAGADAGHVTVEDPVFGGYLANVSPALWRERFRALVPRELDGRSFLDRFGGTPDAATRVDPDRTYQIGACTEHPILENDRVRGFRDFLLTGDAASEVTRVALGELMYASHASYSACGLGSEGTDRLAELVRAAGPAAGLYGAKITGGGSGGTVAVLARRDSRPAILAIAARYERETGRPCRAITGSSEGSRAFGLLRLDPVRETR